MDWRHAWGTTYRQTVKELREERETGRLIHRDVYGEVCHPKDMDDDEIDEVARHFATRITERAIRQYNDGATERKQRKGQAA